MGDIAQIIRENYHKMSKTQKKIADRVLTKPSQFFALDISEAAALLEVSKSTLTRFTRLIGFGNYAELKKASQAQLISDFSPFGIKEKFVTSLRDSDEVNMLRDCLSRERDHFSTQIEQLDYDRVEKLARSLCRARTIYLIGLGAAATVVSFLAFRLRRIGLDVRPIAEGGYAMIEKLTAMSPQDLLLAISFQRVYDEVLTAAEHAAEIACPLFVWTENPLSKLALLTENYIVIPRGESGRLNSVAFPLAVSNALAVRTAALMGNKLDNAIRQLDKLNQNLKKHLGEE